MIKRDCRGHSYCGVRGEILGSLQDARQRKHLPRLSSLIKKKSRRIKGDQIPPKFRPYTIPTRNSPAFLGGQLSRKPKSLDSGGSMVAMLKLDGIDGRAPPGVEPAA
ncbi:hypothetical protein HOLleu_19138 [Holothuria leucospilota]|uniref:Uncharacterized protein n=1 Tax=Holothuria leucospilota TaxID=206669 RepID=A0A9Q1H9M9_HOLLE|nr:hypothetical protein HOLleu_19138 [Holothuria leucospilota]